MMNHPLAMIDNDDDNDSVIMRSNKSSNSNQMSRSTHPSDSWPKLDPILAANKFKAKVNKRMAPRAPDELHSSPNSADNKTLNFFMPVEHVRWFYKTEKEKNHHSTNNNNNSNVLNSTTTILEKTPDLNNISPSGGGCLSGNDPNNNVIKITVVKKWEMFNKWDSINLETKYRELMIRRKNSNLPPLSEDDPSVLVQVQNYSYEVNLLTKKCHPIYLKNGKKIKVQRCLWYRDSNEPFDEKVGEEIEKRHVELFRDVLTSKSSAGGENGVATTPVMPNSGGMQQTFQEDTSSIHEGSLNGDPPVVVVATKATNKTTKNEPSKNQNLERNTFFFVINL
jgi:hypothetical protein